MGVAFLEEPPPKKKNMSGSIDTHRVPTKSHTHNRKAELLGMGLWGTFIHDHQIIGK